jgi:alpha-L-fucosidase
VDFLEMGDNQFPDKWPGKPWQSPATMQHSWSYHAEDYSWKPSGQMIQLLSQCTALGGNYLLNIGPKFDGSLPAPTVRRLREIGAWMAANNASIQGAKRLGHAPWGWWTQSKDGSIRYAHVHRWPADETLPLGKLDAIPAAAAILETGQPLKLTEKDGEWSLHVPKNAPDAWDAVIELRISAP